MPFLTRIRICCELTVLGHSMLRDTGRLIAAPHTQNLTNCLSGRTLLNWLHALGLYSYRSRFSYFKHRISWVCRVHFFLFLDCCLSVLFSASADSLLICGVSRFWCVVHLATLNVCADVSYLCLYSDTLFLTRAVAVASNNFFRVYLVCVNFRIIHPLTLQAMKYLHTMIVYLCMYLERQQQ